MKLIGTLVALYLGMCLALAQQCEIDGVLLLSSDSSQVVGAHIALKDKASSTIAQAVSNHKGYFSLTANRQKAYQLEISFVGLRPMLLRVEGLGNRLSLGKLYLEESESELGTVVVEASKTPNINRQLLFPRQSQIESSHDIFALLKQMNLNGLVITAVEKAVSLNDKPVHWLINGIPRTYEDVQALSPADVLRIEYSDTPSARYLDQGFGGSINVVLHKRAKGGSMRVSLASALWTGFANGSLYAEHNFGESQLSLSYRGSYRRYTKWRRDLEQEFVRDNQERIIRREEGEDSGFGTNMHDINLAYLCQLSEKSQFSLTWRNSISTQRNDIYSLMHETARQSYRRSIHSLYGGYTPALDLFYQQSINKRSKLELNLLGTISRGHGQRDLYDYSSGSLERSYHNPSKNRYSSLIAELAYMHTFSSSAELSLGANYKLSRTRDEYKSPSLIVNRLKTSNLYLYTQLSGRLSPKWQYSIGGGFKDFHTESDGAERHFARFQGRMGLLYYPLQGLSISLNTYFTPTLPSLAQLSSIYQQYDEYITHTGSPSLRASYSYVNALQASYKYKSLSTSVKLSYNYTDAPIYVGVRYRANERDWLYQTSNARYDSNLGVEWTASVSEIFGILNLQAKLGHKSFRNQLEGELYSDETWYGDLSAQISYKDWTLAAYYGYSPSALYNFTKTERKPDLALSLMWQKGNWTLYTQVMSLGSRFGDYYSEIRYSAVSPMRSVVTIGDNANMLTLGAVWNFRYGKQIQRKGRNTQNYDYANSIVKL